jgi:hypothetical protein
MISIMNSKFTRAITTLELTITSYTIFHSIDGKRFVQGDWVLCEERKRSALFKSD